MQRSFEQDSKHTNASDWLTDPRGSQSQGKEAN
jgi:hypothetical protein